MNGAMLVVQEKQWQPQRSKPKPRTFVIGQKGGPPSKTASHIVHTSRKMAAGQPGLRRVNANKAVEESVGPEPALREWLGQQTWRRSREKASVAMKESSESGLDLRR